MTNTNDNAHFQQVSAAISKLEALVHTRTYLELLEKDDMDAVIMMKLDELPVGAMINKEQILECATRLASLRPQLRGFKIYTGAITDILRVYTDSLARLEGVQGKPKVVSPPRLGLTVIH